METEILFERILKKGETLDFTYFINENDHSIVSYMVDSDFSITFKFTKNTYDSFSFYSVVVYFDNNLVSSQSVKCSHYSSVDGNLIVYGGLF